MQGNIRAVVTGMIDDIAVTSPLSVASTFVWARRSRGGNCASCLKNGSGASRNSTLCPDRTPVAIRD